VRRVDGDDEVLQQTRGLGQTADGAARDPRDHFRDQPRDKQNDHELDDVQAELDPAVGRDGPRGDVVGDGLRIEPIHADGAERRGVRPVLFDVTLLRFEVVHDDGEPLGDGVAPRLRVRDLAAGRLVEFEPLDFRGRVLQVVLPQLGEFDDLVAEERRNGRPEIRERVLMRHDFFGRGDLFGRAGGGVFLCHRRERGEEHRDEQNEQCGTHGDSPLDRPGLHGPGHTGQKKTPRHIVRGVSG
jgi:hypothetical protein